MTTGNRPVRIAVIVGHSPEAIKLGPVGELLGAQGLVAYTGWRYSAGTPRQPTPVVVRYAHDDRRAHRAGRSRADERFWTTVDEVCHADGALVAGFHELEAAKAEHE